jgi:hypothetical protein
MCVCVCFFFYFLILSLERKQSAAELRQKKDGKEWREKNPQCCNEMLRRNTMCGVI